jgi:hypothetical protein
MMILVQVQIVTRRFFNDMETGPNDFSIHISCRQLSRVIQCKIYSLQAMMVACGTINLSYEVLE